MRPDFEQSSLEKELPGLEQWGKLLKRYLALGEGYNKTLRRAIWGDS
jgi:hypothetical protein